MAVKEFWKSVGKLIRRRRTTSFFSQSRFLTHHTGEFQANHVIQCVIQRFCNSFEFSSERLLISLVVAVVVLNLYGVVYIGKGYMHSIKIQTRWKLLWSPLSVWQRSIVIFYIECFFFFPNQLSLPSVNRFSRNFATLHSFIDSRSSTIRIFSTCPFKRNYRTKSSVLAIFSDTVLWFCDVIPYCKVVSQLQ